MIENATIEIDLPDLLFGTFQVVTHGHLETQREEIRRIICGLSGLSGADMRSLAEPPQEAPFWELRFDLERTYLDKLLEASRISRMDNSSIFRRIFYALITEKVDFVTRKNTGAEFCTNHTRRLRRRGTNPSAGPRRVV